MKTLIGSMMILLVLPFSAAATLPPPTDDEILKLVQANLEAAGAGDVEGILATCHSESLSVVEVEQMVDQLRAYKLDFDVRKVEFIAMSGEYALIRLLQHTRRVSGPDFMDNAIDTVWALRQEDGVWKFWSQMILRLEPLGREPNPTEPLNP